MEKRRKGKKKKTKTFEATTAHTAACAFLTGSNSIPLENSKGATRVSISIEGLAENTPRGQQLAGVDRKKKRSDAQRRRYLKPASVYKWTA